MGDPPRLPVARLPEQEKGAIVSLEEIKARAAESSLDFEVGKGLSGPALEEAGCNLAEGMKGEPGCGKQLLRERAKGKGCRGHQAGNRNRSSSTGRRRCQMHEGWLEQSQPTTTTPAVECTF